MPPRSVRIVVVSAVTSLLACSPLPEADSFGRRVQVGSDLVDQVCGGTLTRLDAEVESIEDRLGLPHERDRISVYVVSDDLFEDYCEDEVRGCYQAPLDRVLLRDGTFDASVTHELTHAIAWRRGLGMVPLFFAEGLAVALAPPQCELAVEPPDLDEMLASGGQYSRGPERNYVAGKLVAWLLQTHGPDKVLGFIDALHVEQPPNSIRRLYFEWFGTSIDEDAFAHWDTDGRTAPEYDYLAPVVRPDGEVARFALTADLDCGSPRVHNDFTQPELGWVEWTVAIDDRSHSGQYTVIGEIPEGTRLEYQRASCLNSVLPDGGWSEVREGHTALLAGTIQRVRWSGPLGSAPLNIELQGPCDPVRQNCPTGLVCSQVGQCRPLGDSPAGLGEPCEEDYRTGPLACEQGLVCIGDDILDGVPEGACVAGCAFDGQGCPFGTSCDPRWDLCVRSCDPLEQDCDDGQTCYPSGSEGMCVPTNNRSAGEPCRTGLGWRSGFACGPGLVCQSVPECEGEDASWGCCVPLCRLDAPTCPSELPQCTTSPFHDLGMCRP